MKLEFKRLPNGEGLPLPHYASAGAAAMDICSAENTAVGGNETKLIRTGFAVAVPEGYEIQVRPRSGLAYKHRITVANSPGTIDSDYRGEICILLHNLASSRQVTNGLEHGTLFEVCRGDRIAQLVLAPVVQADIQEVSELSETIRGAGGFGSTGRN